MTSNLTSARWVLDLTDDWGARQLGDSTWARGLSYAASGHVLNVTSADRGRILLAEVRGNRPTPYQTLITSSGDGGPRPTWTSRCSCPMVTECKHVAAVLVAVRDQLRAAEVVPTPQWESVLSGVVGDGGAEHTEPGMPLGLVIEENLRMGPRHVLAPVLVLRPTRWLQAGRWAKKLGWGEVDGYGRQPGRASHVRLLTDVRRAAFQDANRYAYYGMGEVSLDTANPAVWRALLDCVAGGLALMSDTDRGDGVVMGPVDLDLTLDVTGGGGDLSIRVEFGDDGFPAEAERRLVGDPGHGLCARWSDEHGHEQLGLAGLARPVPPSLRDVVLDPRPLTVPAGDAARFRRLFLPRLAGRIRVVSSDGSVELEAPPELVLLATVSPLPEHGIELGLALAHDLGGGEVAPVADSGRVAARDAAEEQRLARELTLLDDVPGARRVIGPREHVELAPLVRLRGLAAARFAVDTLPRLEAHPRVRVRIRGDLAAYEEVTEAPTVELGAGPDGDNDWLDLHVTVTVGEEVVPFEPLFEALVRGDEAMVLESGSWFRLDHPDLVTLRDLIAEARQIADRPRPDGLRLGRYHLGLLDELSALGEVEGAGAWLERVAALRDLDLAPRPVPEGVLATLRDYQADGYQWLAALWDAGLGGILADDMGLGKTLQALALVEHAKEGGELTAPALVVAPTSVLETWRSEAERFAPGLAVAVVDRTERRRRTPLADLVEGADLVITSYAVLRIDEEAFRSLTWRALFVDEAQFVKNPRAKAHLVLRRLGAPFTLVLTGTPLENSLMDLWAMLALAAPGLYPRADSFSEIYRRPIESGRAPELLDRLRRRIRPLMLRRTKSEVATELPPKIVQRLDLALGAAHERVYQQHLQRERQRVLGLLEDPDANRVEILASLTRLRQLALDPGLVDDEHADVGSAKLDALVEHLTELAGEGHRVLVFSQFTRFLRRAEARLHAAGVSTAYLDGATRDRTEVIRGFKTGDATAFLISLKAGGFGLTLTEADYVFVLDPWWNPAAEAQAIDRAHRIGQDKPVNVYRLISTGTIEEKVVALQERKRDLFERVVDEGGTLSGTLTADDIRALLEGD